MKTIQWGILGCGNIANKFCSSIASVEHGVVAACASRTEGKADAFAQKHHIPSAYSDYESLLKREDIDAVYVATTHNFHHEMVCEALRHGKAVLCEKPLAVSEVQAEEMVETARAHKVFLMEGMWTRFLPAIQHMKSWLREGKIGEVRMVRADFCFRIAFDPASRLLNPDLAGGAMWDVGIYPISMASFIMEDQPAELCALADVGSTGVDEQSAYLFRYSNGALALLSSAVRSPSENRLEICGSEGRIVIPGSFHCSRTVQLHRNGEEPVLFDEPLDASESFRFEIIAVQNALQNGDLECGEMPLDESVAIAKTMDRIKSSWEESA
jgi:predicted dehydrogenase